MPAAAAAVPPRLPPPDFDGACTGSIGNRSATAFVAPPVDAVRELEARELEEEQAGRDQRNGYKHFRAAKKGATSKSGQLACIAY